MSHTDTYTHKAHKTHSVTHTYTHKANKTHTVTHTSKKTSHTVSHTYTVTYTHKRKQDTHKQKKKYQKPATTVRHRAKQMAESVMVPP